ncbi:MAG: hypothetical protein JKY37_33830 [Nannocystaceae bacterium]|nr:hypothetical protein [Nannocystaceae bacterium]
MNETDPSEISPDTGATEPDGSSGDVQSATTTTDDCLPGRTGCTCDEGTCDSGIPCVDGLCDPTIPSGCGDGDTLDPEDCDDGNNDPGDGCSPWCMLEPECFVAHLGGGGETSLVRSYRVFADGTIAPHGQIDVPAHNPPMSGPGSELSRAAVSCAGRVYIASSTSGTITGLEITGGDIVAVSDASVPLVRELACDPALGVLFAIRFVDNGFAIDTFDVSNGMLIAGSSDVHIDLSIPQVRSVRLSLDRDSPRALLSFVEDGTSSNPLVFIEALYEAGQITLGSPEPLGVVGTDLSALVFVPTHSQLLGVGTRTTGGPAAYRLPVSEKNVGPLAIHETPPWDSRRNIWPLRLSTGEPGFAMGGPLGVVIGAYAESGALEVRGNMVSPELANTFARTAFADEVLIVASPTGLQTYDLTQVGPAGDWALLSELAEDMPETFTSGAVMACF